jgi:SNF2 family DNA or RNA helicase
MEKVLVVTPASLKEQWRREIERFTDEKAIVIAGPKRERRTTYLHNNAYFKITNYEAVLRDIDEIRLFQPDLIILDEAQRIKNFETKTFQTIQSVPHKQSLVLTGTPLENKLEDFYAISQFADADLFTPLWNFAANHFILRKSKKNKIFGYKNLQALHEKLPALVIRRRKEEVLSELPQEVTNNYYIELSGEQFRLHQGYLSSLLPYINKKFLTPMDIQRIRELLTCMRMVCNSTFLVDRNTNISPKLRELEVVLNDVAIENKRKIVIFSEWTTMTFLIGKVLSELSIPFVELSGKIPTAKRQRLIDEFTNNQSCQVFLSTDAGGVGLNLQAADCVINFELPWNPARLNQRIGRVSRIGQKSSCINVINFIARNSIEERILAGIHLKLELFDAVFDGTSDEVEFSRERKIEFINKIREMLGQEQEPLPKHEADKEELPDETPHYLNPKVLSDQEEDMLADQDVSMEEEMPTPSLTEQPESAVADKQQTDFAKMESVMENGMSFLSGLMQMATGKPLVSETGEKMITINKETGEVTLKFKLPV